MSKYPIMIYGVNLFEIPRERKNLPDEIDRAIGINVEKLEERVEDCRLVLHIKDNYLENDNVDEESVHIGEMINDNYATFYQGDTFEDDFKDDFCETKREHRGFLECPSYDIEQIIQLKNDSSELIRKLKLLGLNVEPEDLRLYGCVEDD